MRILVVAPELPWPLNRGNRVRMYNMITELASQHEVDLFCASPNAEAEARAEAMRQLQRHCRRVTAVDQPNATLPGRIRLKVAFELAKRSSDVLWEEFYYGLPGFAGRLEDRVREGEYDVLFVNYWYSAPSSVLGSGVAAVCDLHDVFSLKVQRDLALAGVNRTSDAEHVLRLRRREAAVLAAYDHLVCVHDEDVRLVREGLGVSTPSTAIVTVRGERLAFSHPPAPGSRVLFFGALHSLMNRDAASLLAERILPAVRERVPGAELIIAGSGVTRDISRLGRLSWVDVLGEVGDLGALFSSAACLAMPLRTGSGVKGRILEAMEAGLPVVGSSIAAEGLGAVDGETMLVRDGAGSFVDAVVTLINDSDLRLRLAVAARRMVEERFSWAATYGLVQGVVQEAADTGRIRTLEAQSSRSTPRKSTK